MSTGDSSHWPSSAGKRLLGGFPAAHARPALVPIIEDVFTAPTVREIRADSFAYLCQTREYRYLSLDATITYRAPKHVREAAFFDDDAALRRVLPVRGCTGAVLAMIAVPSEIVDIVSSALAESLPVEGLVQVECVASDSASTKLYTALRRVMPNLQCLCLDPIHLAIVYELPF